MTSETTTENTTEVSTDGTTEVTTEEELGNLIITVVEEETNRVVPGAEVEVKYPDGSTVTYITDEKGQITLTDVPVGGYSIVVKKVPEGYTVTTGETAICTVTAGATTEHEAKIVTKTDSTTESTSENTAVKTDDPTQTTPFIFAMLVSIAGMIFFVGRKKKLNR